MEELQLNYLASQEVEDADPVAKGTAVAPAPAPAADPLRSPSRTRSPPGSPRRPSPAGYSPARTRAPSSPGGTPSRRGGLRGTGVLAGAAKSRIFRSMASRPLQLKAQRDGSACGSVSPKPSQARVAAKQASPGATAGCQQLPHGRNASRKRRAPSSDDGPTSVPLSPQPQNRAWDPICVRVCCACLATTDQAPPHG